MDGVYVAKSAIIEQDEFDVDYTLEGTYSGVTPTEPNDSWYARVQVTIVDTTGEEESIDWSKTWYVEMSWDRDLETGSRNETGTDPGNVTAIKSGSGNEFSGDATIRIVIAEQQVGKRYEFSSTSGTLNGVQQTTHTIIIHETAGDSVVATETETGTVDEIDSTPKLEVIGDQVTITESP